MNELVNIIYLALNTFLFLAGISLAAGVAGGALVGVFQAFTNIKDSALNYGVKILVFIVLFFFGFEFFSQGLIELLKKAFN